MRLGLVGSDSDARRRAERYERLPGVTIGGIAAPGSDPGWSTARYDDIVALLADEEIEAVDVCDSNVGQHEIVDACLDEGVGVVCSTPLADDLEGALSIRDASERSKVPVLVDGLHRFARENRSVKDSLEAGDIGKPTTVRTGRRIPIADLDHLDGDAQREAVLQRALYPDVARVRWLFGDIERVFTRTVTGESADERHHHAVVIAQFVSGAIGHLDIRVGNRHDRIAVDFEYSGTKGRLSYDSEEFSALDVRATRPLEPGVADRLRRPRPSSDLYHRHAEHVVACLCGDEDPVEPADEAVESLRTVLAAVESFRCGAAVTVAEVTT